jgi:hypothetical protein
MAAAVHATGNTSVTELDVWCPTHGAPPGQPCGAPVKVQTFAPLAPSIYELLPFTLIVGDATTRLA